MPHPHTLVAVVALLTTALATNPTPHLPTLTRQFSRQPTRTQHNLIYWTPSITLETPTARFLKALASTASLSYSETKLAAYRAPETFTSRVGTTNCTLFVGQIRTVPVSNRPHEAAVGALITSTRDVYADLVARYFFRTGRKYDKDALEIGELGKNSASIWFMNMEEYDACDAFRYYDGIPGCVHETLEDRAAKIAARIDCVINVEDAQPDVQALCKTMGVSDCPQFKPYKKDMYSAFLGVPQIRDTLQVHAKVFQVLRDALLQRRCRDVLRVGDGEAVSGDLPPARWPTPGCGK